MAVETHIVVWLVMTACTLVSGYQQSGEDCLWKLHTTVLGTLNVTELCSFNVMLAKHLMHIHDQSNGSNRKWSSIHIMWLSQLLWCSLLMEFLLRHGAGNRLGILPDHVLHDNARRQWPFLRGASTATRFVADTSKGKPYTTSGHNQRQGTRWPCGVFCKGVHELKVGKKLRVCSNHPAHPKKTKEQPDTELHRMAGMEGPLS